MSFNGISLAICKSAPRSRQPRQQPTTQFSTGRLPFLPPNQQRQSTEGIKRTKVNRTKTNLTGRKAETGRRCCKGHGTVNLYITPSPMTRCCQEKPLSFCSHRFSFYTGRILPPKVAGTDLHPARRSPLCSWIAKHCPPFRHCRARLS